MAETKITYGSVTTISVEVNLLASSATAGRESVVIDNSSNLYLDAMVTAEINAQGGTPANDKAVYIWVYGGDGISKYTGNVTGTNAAYTRNEPTTLRLLGTVPIPTNAVLYVGGPFSVANAFGGELPPRWGVVVQNYSGQVLSTVSNVVRYFGITATTA